jgi:dTDP-4-dehydrorhamnose 3,5-epimerase
MNELFQTTDIAGCFVFKNKIFTDQRGTFTKVFAVEAYRQAGINMSVAEIFFSRSKKDVVRGMHFQTPPYDHGKIVTCLTGRILDVVLDLRKDSGSFGKFLSFDLSAETEGSVIIPRGCAHGFYSYQDNTLVSYAVETGHQASADQGVLWNSFGFRWPTDDVIISDRDKSFPKLSEFKSPF